MTVKEERMIDFFMRHGMIKKDDKDYEKLESLLVNCRKVKCYRASWKPWLSSNWFYEVGGE